MDSNALITISYTVPEGKKAEFQNLVAGLVQRINQAQNNVQLSVFRSEDDPNQYVELYECDSTQSYDALEDSLDEEIQNTVRRIASDFATQRQTVTTMKKIY